MIAWMTSGARHTGLAVGLLLFASASALSQPQRGRPAAGDREDRDPSVMSDTAGWCAHFAAELDAMARATMAPHPQADRLVIEGRRLCSSGHVRLGVLRLRYALIELHDH